MYRYIGNKSKLLPRIIAKIGSLVPPGSHVADLMAGTGSVSYELRKQGYKLIASDVMTYSYCHLVTKLLLSQAPPFQKLVAHLPENVRLSPYYRVLAYLNNLEPIEGFFHREFSPDGIPTRTAQSRKYFTSANAKKIDAIRLKINEWKDADYLSSNEEALLKHNLILAVNEVANISGTYGYFLSNFSKSSLSSLTLVPEDFCQNNDEGHVVLQGFAEEVSTQVSADLCYIDPPYMKRQYAANYHILETIARGDEPDAIGKSGLRDWWDQHSALCTRTKGLQSLEKIIKEMNCPTFVISYSEDGLFSLDELIGIFSSRGEVSVDRIIYNRFRSNYSSLPKSLYEYLITVKK